MKHQAGGAGQQLPLSSPPVSVKSWSTPGTINLSVTSSLELILIHNS